LVCPASHPDGRLQVKPDHLLVPLPGALPDRTLERGEPSVEVVAYSQVLTVLRDALAPVSQQFLYGDIPTLHVCVLVLSYAASILHAIHAALSLFTSLAQLPFDRLSKPSERTGRPP